MRVYCLGSLSELEPYREAWERLAAGMPMHGWTWCSTWWRHYGTADNSLEADALHAPRLNVLAVFDETDTLVGLAPWYRRWSATTGWALASLGDGEVCSDYPTLLIQPGLEESVVVSLAEYLRGCNQGGSMASDDEHPRSQDHAPCWDLIDLDSVPDADPRMSLLFDELGRLGHQVHRRPGPGLWRVELPDAWDDYLARLSKGHRKRMRRLLREWDDSGRAHLCCIDRLRQLPKAMDILVDLHQRRWNSVGEPGCFSSPRFEAFHREVAPQLLSEGHLRMSLLLMDGRPAAAEYYLSGAGVLYSYQVGVDPERQADQAGRLAMAMILRRAVEQGYRAFDLLRGDEPYKHHWRAERQPTHHVRVVARRASARLRHQAWLAGRTLKRWATRRSAEETAEPAAAGGS